MKKTKKQPILQIVIQVEKKNNYKLIKDKFTGMFHNQSTQERVKTKHLTKIIS